MTTSVLFTHPATNLLAIRLRQRRVPEPLHVQAEHFLVPAQAGEEQGALSEEGAG